MKIKESVFIEAIFVLIALTVYFITGNSFFIFNFLYIGTGLAIAIFLMSNDYSWGRNIVLLVI